MPLYRVPLYIEVDCPGENMRDAAHRAIGALRKADAAKVLRVYQNQDSDIPMLAMTDVAGEAISMHVATAEELNQALSAGTLELVAKI